MEKQPLLGFRRGIHNSENTEEKQTLITGTHDADVTVATERVYINDLFYSIDLAISFSLLVEYLNNIIFQQRSI